MAGAMVFMALRSKGGSMYMLISVPIILTSLTASVLTYFSQKKKYRKTLAKRERVYSDALSEYQEELQRAYDQQKIALCNTDPNPQQCIYRVENRDRLLWERSPKDEDFLSLRLGVGEKPLALSVKVPQEGVTLDADPMIIKAQEMAGRFKVVKGVPVRFPLGAAGIAGLAGPRDEVLGIIRCLVIQIATHHSPDEVKIVAVFPDEEMDEWNWMRWLPHVWSEDHSRRLLACDKQSAHDLLTYLYGILNRRQLHQGFEGKGKFQGLPYYVVILSDPQLAEDEPVVSLLLSDGPDTGAITVFLGDNIDGLPKSCTMVAEADSLKGVLLRDLEGSVAALNPDHVDLRFTEEYSRAMAPIRLRGIAKVAEIPNAVTLLDIWEVSDIEELDARENWQSNKAYKTLAVPIGIGGGGKRMIFDLHEKAHGPHGLVAGATGSGKSELLQSMIGALAVNFHPHDVAFVLVDYKGGGTANAFLELPHVVGVMTNLEGNLTARALIAIKSELQRRQRLLADAGINHIDGYQKLHRAGQASVPLPHLIIIIDEFAELASDQPDFLQELVSTVRVGRSLGVHLILATQKPAGVVNEQIWGNTRFRLCLRVERDEDSREVLKKTDAANITLPGRAYLQVGNDELFELFQSAWAGAPYIYNVSSGDGGEIREVTLDGARTRHKKSRETTSFKSTKTQIQALQEYLSNIAKEDGIERLPGPWLPPLPETYSFEEIMQGCPYGWDGESWNEPESWLEPIVGIVDDPSKQYQGPLTIELGKEGHLAIFGIPGSGRTTFLQTLIRSLTFLHTPQNVNIYIMDFGGRTLNLFAPLPHVGDVVFEDDEEKVRRLLEFLLRELESRKGLFAQSGVNTLLAYRAATGEPLPAIVVVLDNYTNFTTSYEDQLGELLARLVQEGGGVGIHFVISGTSPTQMRIKISSNISLAVALELAERGDYAVAVGRTGGLYPDRVRGRGMMKGTPPLEFQTALPASGDTEADRASSIRSYAEKMASCWDGPKAPRIPTLPQEIGLDELIDLEDVGHKQGERTTLVPIGVAADDIKPTGVDLESGPYFLVSGPLQSGKTTLMRTWLLSLCALNGPESLRLWLVDFGRSSFKPLRQLPHTESYVHTSQGFEGAMNKLVEELNERKRQLENGESAMGDTDEPVEVLQEKPILLMAIDDFYLFRESAMSDQTDELERIIRRERGLGFYLLVGGSTGDFSSCYDGYLKAMLATQTGFLLGSSDHEDLQVFKLRLPPEESGKAFPPGLGYFIKRGRTEKLKIALPQGEGLSFTGFIEKVAELSKKTPN